MWYHAAWYKNINISEDYITFLKMEAAGSPGMLVMFYYITYIQEDN
jgi:hypothetical protein